MQIFHKGLRIFNEGQWKSIADLGKLQVALETFVDIPPSWILYDDISKTNDDTNKVSAFLSDASKEKDWKDELKDFIATRLYCVSSKS